MKTLLALITTLLASLSLANPKDAQYQQALQSMSPQKITVESVTDTPVKGIKQVVVSGSSTKEVIYLSEDGAYIFDGNLLSIKDQVNLTELTQNSLRNELMNEFKKSHNSIDFLPAEMTDQVTVFTDIDCGVCRKFHENINAFNQAGIGVSYLFYPRAGIGSASHQKAVNVWCAKDQQQAINQAIAGANLEPLMCPNPIESQYKLALNAGIKGTPYIVLADGTLIPGYQTPEQLKQRIALSKSKH